ncbi:hypothetical protein ABK040_003008 [Willaertia magna]
MKCLKQGYLLGKKKIFHNNNYLNLVGNNNLRHFNVNIYTCEEQVVSVDTSGLVLESYAEDVVKENETAMIKHLKNKIKGAGPISVSTFIQESLLNPAYGYYYTAKYDSSSNNQQQSDNNSGETNQRVIGREGDFVTSPEITSVFGEVLGVWCVDMWDRMGRPSEIEILELGPGKGTLMHDILDSLNHSKYPIFSSFKKALKKVHLIEASETLKEVQKVKLDKFKENIEFKWDDRLEKYTSIESHIPILIIAHEFFDALPVYQFQYTERGWVEVLIDIDDSKETKNHFKFVLSPGPTMATAFVHLTEGPKEIGAKREVNAMGIGYTERICEILKNRGGSALIIDYGNDCPMGFTLQGIEGHKFTDSPLDKPGEVDLSTFVDFSSLKTVAKKFTNIKIHGPQYQSDFLHQLSMDTRFAKLLQNPKLSDEQIENLIGAYERLTNPKEMGHHYKAMVLSNLPYGVNPTGFDSYSEPSKEAFKEFESKESGLEKLTTTMNDSTTSGSSPSKLGPTSPLKKQDKKGKKELKGNASIFL